MVGSRNLIVEDALASKAGFQFVPNDIDMSAGKALVLTGPNMGGKSCYLRQVGIMSILAQMGSFVPALEASLPIFDALFVRLGAKDEIEQGKSTLFVELEETSLILNLATSMNTLEGAQFNTVNTSTECRILPKILFLIELAFAHC